MSGASSIPSLSVVIPVYNEQNTIRRVIEEIEAVISRYPQAEIVVVDDGSYDGTYEQIEECLKQFSNIKALRYPRNMGKSHALSVAFANTTGDIVITIDGDGQFYPQEIPKFVDKICEGYDFVNGFIKNKHRNESIVRAINSKLFNLVSSMTFRTSFKDANCGFKAFKGNIAKKVYLSGGEHRYLAHIIGSWGYRTTEVPVEYKERTDSKSRYNSFATLLDGFFDLVKIKLRMARTTHPLATLSFIGMILILLGIIMGAQILILNMENRILSAVPYVVLDSLLLSIGFLCIVLGFILDELQDIKNKAITVNEIKK